MYVIQASPITIALIASRFDEEVDEEERQIRADMRIDSVLRRGCLLRLLMYPMEWFLTRVMVGERQAAEKTFLAGIYWGVFRGHLTGAHISLASQQSNARLMQYLKE
jgi:hypothetical protein